MKNLLKSRILISSMALLFGTASSVVVSAAALSELTADQISRDASLSFDSATGASAVVMGGFEPFEDFADLAGTATLKSTGQAVSINGRVLSDGALLDLTLIYTTESNDPFDMRGYERGVFLSRDRADSVRYDNRIVECSENVTELTYGESYGSAHSVQGTSVPFGFLAGVYMPFPLYRGLRGVGRYSAPIRGYSNRYYSGGFSSYGYTVPRAATRTGRNRNIVAGRGGDHRNRIRDGERRSDHSERDRRHDGREARADRDIKNRDRERGERNGTMRDRDRERDQRGRNGRDRGQETSNRNRRPPGGLAGMRSDTPRAETRPSRRRAPVTQPLVSRNNNNQDRGVSTVKSPPPKVSAARPERNRAERNRAERNRAERTRIKRPRKDRNASTNSRESRPTSPVRSQRQRINRSVDRNFRSKNPRASQRKTFKNFYPLQSSFGTYANPVSVSYNCVREEKLTVHIPNERLQAARFDGMTVLVLSRDGQEMPVYIPPNYIEGYQKARQMIGQTSYTSDPNVTNGYPLITK